MAVTAATVVSGGLYFASCVVSLTVLVKLVQFLIRMKKRNDMIEKFPGATANFFWGNLLDYPGPNEAGLKYQREQTGKFPRVSRGWLGPFFPLIIIYHPDTVKTILRTSEPKGKQIYRLIEPWIGDGLLLSGGNKWARNRRLLTPAFHFDILRPYQAINNRVTDVLLDKLESFKGDYFEISNIISMYTLDVILQCAFSYKTDCQNIGEKHPYVRSVSELIQLITKRFFKPWLHNDLIYLLTSDGRCFKRHCDYVHKIAQEIIAKRRLEIQASETTKKQLDFLDILLTARDEENVGLTDLEIRNEVDTFLFEGHDTTSSAISWTLYSLAGHPDIQKKVQEEVDQVLEGRESNDILWEDLPKLTYLTMCLKEGMRLHCPVPVIVREITQETEIDGIPVPVGQSVMIQIYSSHHNPTVWENSLEFIPERFSPENIEKRDPFAFIPFSAGPRNCIGQNFAMHEMKTVLARILRGYTVELDPNHEVAKTEGPVMRAERGIMMKVKPRK